MAKWKLIAVHGNKTPGAELKPGDKVKDFRGDEVEIVRLYPPHKPSSSGKVAVKETGSEFERTFFVTVIGARFVPNWFNPEEDNNAKR